MKECLIKMENGWMDGKLVRRRTKGYDYLIIKLGKPGKIFNVDIDTSHFSG